MRHFRYFSLIAATALIGAPTTPSPIEHVSFPKPVEAASGAVPLSVMTYNVKGLPWPAASGRPESLAEIGARLRAMRGAGVQPNVVMLQEGFSEDARRLGQESGYRHVAFGPERAVALPHPPLGSSFAEDGQVLKGEGVGELLDSGLVILSDYPIVRLARFSFPQGACAGYDCLAAKGVMVAWLAVPGTDRPIAVVDTHLNARKAAMVSGERVDEAYRWQVAAVRRYLGRVIGSDTPVILAGDLNIGAHAQRQSAVAAPLIGGGQREALADLVAEGRVPETSNAEARGVLQRNKDKIFVRSSGDVSITPERAWVPFPLLTTSRPLSDHAGFVVDFAVATKGMRSVSREGSGGRTRART